jgi:hypothetical protein
MEVMYSVTVNMLDGRPRFHYATSISIDSTVSAGLLVIDNAKTKNRVVYVVSGNVSSYEFQEITKESE